MADFLKAYYQSARRTGVIIDGKIPNPDVNNLAYFSEMMGQDFRLDRAFLDGKLRRWLPRMADPQRGHRGGGHVFHPAGHAAGGEK